MFNWLPKKSNKVRTPTLIEAAQPIINNINSAKHQQEVIKFFNNLTNSENSKMALYQTLLPEFNFANVVGSFTHEIQTEVGRQVALDFMVSLTEASNKNFFQLYNLIRHMVRINPHSVLGILLESENYPYPRIEYEMHYSDFYEAHQMLYVLRKINPDNTVLWNILKERTKIIGDDAAKQAIYMYLKMKDENFEYKDWAEDWVDSQLNGGISNFMEDYNEVISDPTYEQSEDIVHNLLKQTGGHYFLTASITSKYDKAAP